LPDDFFRFRRFVTRAEVRSAMFDDIEAFCFLRGSARGWRGAENCHVRIPDTTLFLHPADTMP